MKIIHQGGYGKDELSLYRLTVYKNLIDCSKALIAAMEQFDIQPANPENAENCRYLMEYSVGSDPHTTLDERVGTAVTEMWADPSVPRVLERSSEFYLMDSAP